MDRFLSAPSKLFLTGEYAVLWGGSARVAAVQPRGEAYVRRRTDREIHLALEAGRLQGYCTPLGINWSQDVPGAFSFAARALHEVVRLHRREALGFGLALSAPTLPAGRKLGLGGSARTAVLAAESARYVLEQRLDALKLALLAHAQAQGGRGSGADVAAIFAGGLIRYRRYPVESLLEASGSGETLGTLENSPPVDLWRLPVANLCLAYAFSGEGASTPTLIREIESRIAPASRDQFVIKSDQLGDLAEKAIIGEDFRLLRGVLEELNEHLKTLGPLETEPIARILAIARSYGCAGKMSGAGSGDGCILCAPDLEVRSAMLEGLRSRGFWAIPVSLEAGLRSELDGDPQLRGWLDLFPSPSGSG
jgi:phosphomevalonate kinase